LSTTPASIGGRPRAGRLRRPLGGGPWLALAIVLALVLVSPLVLVGIDVADAGWGEIRTELFRPLSSVLLAHTLELSALVGVLAGVLGVGAAWATERVALPLRRVVTVMLVLPVAMPDFVVGYAWHSLAPNLNPLLASTLVMTLGTYPLVYLPTAAALRRLDPSLEDAARTLGVPPWKVFFTVTLPLLRVAVFGGVLLVILTVISEFGAFEILGYQTFTTEVFTEFKFDPTIAGVLGIPLVIIGLLALFSEALLARRPFAGAAVRPVVRRQRSPRVVIVWGLALAGVLALGVGVPVGTIVYWMTQNDHATLPATATVGAATWTTVRYSALGAAVAVAFAVPFGLMGLRRGGRLGDLIERGTYVTRALPGVIVALALVFFATRYAIGVYETGTLLVAAYALLTFPLAMVCVKASFAQLPTAALDVGRSLGRNPVAVFVRVALPLVAPGLLAGFCLVFLEAMTELTATLVLAPIGVTTLATQFWAFQQNIDYASAAPYALVMIGLAIIPGALLALWFDREREA
jgi:iron(III) transport system permease protein